MLELKKYFKNFIVVHPGRYFIICLDDKTNKPKFVEVIGEKLILEGFEDMDLFITEYPSRWVVSEGITGFQVSKGKDKQTAIENALNVLRWNKREIVSRILECVQMYGMSPRYEKAYLKE